MKTPFTKKELLSIKAGQKIKITYWSGTVENGTILEVSEVYETRSGRLDREIKCKIGRRRSKYSATSPFGALEITD